MSVLYLALAIYIVGVALVLYLRPSVMFHPDNGTWKEFGLGRNPNNYTWCPFWLFCIFWALVSYIISTIAIRIALSGSRTNSVSSNFVSTSDLQDLQNIQDVPRPRRIRRGNELPEGYYVLSKPIRAGETPSYTYLGPDMDA
jgi:hypothetical protein